MKLILSRSLVLSLLSLLVMHAVASGQNQGKSAELESIITDEYAIFPVTTELQRELLQSDTIDVCMFVNGSAFRDVEKIDRFLPVMEQLQKKLSNLPKVNSSGVVFRCIESTNDNHSFSEVKKRLEELSQACEEVGYYAGYLNVKSSRIFHADDFDWRQWIDKAQAAANATDSQEEPVTGNERVQVFFVRTFLSHLLANADAIVTILPVVRTAGSFPDEFVPDLEKYLLPEKGDKLRKAMLLQISFTPSLTDEIDAWIENLEARREFARKLGFEGCNVSPTPTEEADRFTQGPASRLQMQVKAVDPDGKPVKDPKIEFRANPQMQLQKTATDDGIIVKMPGRPTWFNFTIKSPGYVPYYGEWDSRSDGTVLPTEFTAKLELAWRAGGIVVNEAGEPIAGAEIHPSIRMTVRPGDPLEIHTGDRFKADEGGRWTYDHVPLSDNELSVEISHPNYSPDWHRLARSEYELQRDEEPTGKITLKRAVTIRGRVTDDQGQPVANALVRSRFSNIDRQATSDSEGNYELTGCASGMARIVVSAPGKAMQLQQVDVTANMKPLNTVMQPGGHVRVRVVDLDGKPVPKARIFFQQWHGRIHYFEFDHVNQYADDKGVWEWNEAPLEEFTADVCPPGGMQLSERTLQAREEEYVFHTFPVLTVSGKVTDARTGKPLESFHVVPGMEQENRPPYWSDYNRLAQAGGSYVMRFDRSRPGHYVRIEADGYRPAVSRKINSDEGAVTLSFELEPQENVGTMLLTPTGQPAAGAHAYVACAGDQVMIHNGAIRENQTNAKKLDVDEDGKSSFSRPESDFYVVVTHPSGFAHLQSADGVVPREIRLMPWAEIKGVFHVGAAPASNVEIEMWTNRMTTFSEDGPRIHVSYHLKADEAGRFECDRVFPGKARVGRHILLMVNEGATQVTSSQRVPVMLKEGETTEVKIGGTGRPVTGKLIPYQGFGGEPFWKFALVNVTTSGPIAPKRPSPPEDKRGPQESQDWIEVWYKTAEGKQWRKQYDDYLQARDSRPYMTATVDRDGSFRIDDVPAGDYELTVRFNEHSAGMISRHPFTVPPMEGERSDEPLDLGEIQLEKPDPRIE